MAKKLSAISNMIKEETVKINITYEDIKRLFAKKGPYSQSFTIVMYSESETRVILYFLWILRKLTRTENADLNTVVFITYELLEQMTQFFFNEKRVGLKTIPNIITGAKKAMEEPVSWEELNSFLDALLHFFGKLNFIIDSKIPWFELAETFDKNINKEKK